MSTVRLWSFGKKTNSTARPAGTPTEITGTYKGPVDLLRPVMLLDDPSPSRLILNGYNYAFIVDLDRYYWIRNITALTNDMYEVEFEIDPLASWKTSIGASSQYITRSSAAQNGLIPDDVYPTVGNPSVVVDDLTVDIPWSGTALTSGYYVVGIVNYDDNAIGSVNYYVFNQAGMREFNKKLLQNVNYTNMQFSEISEALYKSLYDPMQYVVSCMWFPLAPPYGVQSSFTFRIGFWDIGTFPLTVLCNPITAVTSSGTTTLTTTNHPQISDGDYLNCAPFTSRELYIQPFGKISIDCSTLTDINHVIRLRWYVDFITGQCVLRALNNTTGTIIGEGTAQIGVPIQLSRAENNLIKAPFVLGGAAISRALGSWYGGANTTELATKVQNAFNGLGSALNASDINIDSIGANGSVLAYSVPPVYISRYSRTATKDNAHKGSPLCDIRQISALPGFIMVSDPHCEWAGMLLQEKTAIESFMSTGFYYE